MAYGSSETASARPAARPRRSVGQLFRLQWLTPFAVAASIAILATIAERRPGVIPSRQGPAWSVAAVEGAPRVAAKRVEGHTPFRLGQWLETDAASRAKVTVGVIGEVRVDPNSRLRLAAITETDQRLELARGTLHAMIWAPPRLFFVDTPSATAVDFGCAYTLAVDDDGNGELRVTTGYVALEGKRQAFIPAGLMCLTRRGSGPGTPFSEHAPAPLRSALERFDFEPNSAPAALPVILAEAGAGDTVTLWHLLGRTAGEQRASVFNVLARHHPPPPGVTRAGILAGDDTMRQAWGSELGLGTFAR